MDHARYVSLLLGFAKRPLQLRTHKSADSLRVPRFRTTEHV